MNRAGYCPENSQQASVHVDSVALSVAASFSFLLACILTCPNRYSIECKNRHHCLSYLTCRARTKILTVTATVTWVDLT